jgi:small-conductance mechanosensitive channel
MLERCPRCGLRFERIDGHWSGDLGINTIVSFGALFVTLIVGFALTYPDGPGIPLFLWAVSVAVIVPVLFFPFSKTIWLAIDLVMRPLEPDEVKPEYFIPA